MNTQTQVKTTWNPEFVKLNEAGRLSLGTGRRFVNGNINPQKGRSVNEDRFVAPNGEDCRSVQWAAEHLDIVETSVLNRIHRNGRIIWYHVPHPVFKRMITALPAWQFELENAYILDQIYFTRYWSKQDPMTDFIRTIHPQLKCTPQQAILEGNGEAVLTIVKSMSALRT